MSALQTGNRSGPVGSTDGLGRHREGLTVVEQGTELRLALRTGGRVEIRARANPDPTVMVALWLIGFEEQPAESGEICVMEIFGREIEQGGGLVGMGIHPWYDAALVDDFEKVRVDVDLTEYHDYAVEWDADRTRYFIDGIPVKSSDQAPAYPMQLMLAVFEFEPGGSYPKTFEVARVLAFD
ncbi:beta-glucanase (GH16 family) [Leifsonia sp. AK011]|uniref:glycoside hydrolase family 16 protein n=1 Tax=Leifsonia sp. AK011 TaxID=2723075 RepID=UPI0015C752B3|nr:glycoside hydrolase family 16 protein [Leifsonia sp. AK011]NYF10771.1 beta-glucanase (GH16 family) [Leifsonia sp. AK011]